MLQKRLAMARFQLIDPREERVERAVGRDQINGALLANSRHARHVVASVADEGQHVDDLIRRDAELVEHPLRVEPGAIFPRVVDADAAADQLEEVLVDRDDGDLETGCLRTSGDGADDVVCLVAAGGQDRHPQGLARLVHPVDLLRQIVGHGGAVRLVVGRDTVAKGRPGQVERRGEVGRRMVLNQLAQHGDEHVHGVRRVPLLIGEAAAAERVIRAVHLRAAVDQEEGRAGHYGGYARKDIIRS